MSKNKELDTLFSKWEDFNLIYKNKFVSDGIIEENLFNKASKKILFITKEPNDPLQETSWDFRAIWQDKKYFQNSFTFRIAEWAYGILNNFPPYDELWLGDHGEKLFEALNSIAFMNVKKIGGGSSSEYEAIMNHVKGEKDFIIKQIEVIQPEIIILGLSFWSEIRNLIFENVEWQKSGYGINIGKWNGIHLVDFYHPSSRNAPPASYCLLKNIIQSNNFKTL